MCDIPSLTLDRTDGGKKLRIAYRHYLWIAYMVRRRRTWHAIMAFEKHTRCDYVSHGHSSPTGIIHGHGMLLSPLDNIHGRTISVVRCYHLPWKEYTIWRCQALHVIIVLGHHTWSEDVGRSMPACLLGSTHGWMMLSVGFHYHIWTTYMVGRYCVLSFHRH